jgi:hypothetical protein
VTPLNFSGIPVYKDPAAPTYRWAEHAGPDGVPWVCQRARVEVDYTLVQIPPIEGFRHSGFEKILVHPDKWDTFLEAMEMVNKRKAEAN